MGGCLGLEQKLESQVVQSAENYNYEQKCSSLFVYTGCVSVVVRLF